MKCRHCSESCIKKGKTRDYQRYQCIVCKKYQQETYRYNSYLVNDSEFIRFLKEGLGIRSMGRLFQISNSTVINRILKIAQRLKKQTPIVFGQTYEVDELFTYVGNKYNRICIAYSLNPQTREVIDFIVGRRNKTNLMKITSTLLLSDAKQIVTDKLNIYKELIPNEIHSTKHRGINRIERQNLTLRTHLKRLNRRTICYSKSTAMLYAVVKIYFWG